MAFQKSVSIPGYGFTATYIRLDRIAYIDELARDAQFVFKLYADKTVAAQPGCQGFPAANVRFVTEAFDLYFSKAKLQAAGVSLHALVYKAVADFVEAKKAHDLHQAYLADAANDPAKAPTVTPDQETLVRCVLFPATMLPDIFVGATNV